MTSSTELVVETANGKLLGTRQVDTIVFNGIPYAEPPLGARRWMPPVAATPWTGTLDCIAAVPQAPQNQDLGVFANAGGQEDCLYLNIWMPADADPGRDRLPVMVWFHGGGYSVGTGHDHNGSKIATNGRSIVVTTNYRLGVLGMFSHPSLENEGHPHSNYWLMDQQLALKWVQDNIAAFGGDADRVTIFGESSGGTSVFSHVISPASKGLFHHAIAMSGAAPMLRYPAFGAPIPLDVARAKAIGFARAAGLADHDVASLRNLPTERILALQGPYTMNQGVVDGTIIPDHYADLVAAGKVNGETFTGGVVRHEWNWLVGFIENASGAPMTADGFVASVRDYYGPDLAEKVLMEYRVDDFPTPSEAYGAAVTASLFACTNHKLLQLMSRWMPTFGYEFADTTVPSYLEPTSFSLGAAHTFELAYLFPGYRGGSGRMVGLNAMQERLSDRMVDLFVRSHEATGARLDEWPLYDPAKENYLTFVLPDPKVKSGCFGRTHRTDFWDQTGLY